MKFVVALCVVLALSVFSADCASPHVRSRAARTALDELEDGIVAMKNHHGIKKFMEGLNDFVAVKGEFVMHQKKDEHQKEHNTEHSFLSVGALPDVPADVAAKIPEGLPKSRAEIQRAFASVSASGTVAVEKTVSFDGGWVKVVKDTRVSVSLSADYNNAFVLSFSPALVVHKNWVPVEPKISSLKWNFETAKFEVTAEGFGPDGLYSWVTSLVANSRFRDMVPPRIRAAGYNPRTDSDLEATILEIRSASLGGGGSSSGLSFTLNDVADASAEVAISLPNTVRVPLQAQKAEVTIRSGTRVSLSGSLTGRLSTPRVSGVSIRFAYSPIEIAQSSGTFKELTGVKLRAINVLPGGKVSLDYDMEVEGFASGLATLFGAVVAVGTNGRSGSLDVQNVRLDGIRKMINDEVSKQADPMLQAWLRTYDNVLPGISLVQVMRVN